MSYCFWYSTSLTFLPPQTSEGGRVPHGQTHGVLRLLARPLRRIHPVPQHGRHVAILPQGHPRTSPPAHHVVSHVPPEPPSPARRGQGRQVSAQRQLRREKTSQEAVTSGER